MHDRGSEASDTGDAGGRDRPQPEHESARRKPRSGSRGDRFARPIGATRFWIAVSIAGVGLSSIAMLIFALIVVVRTIFHAFVDGDYTIDGAKHLAVDFIEMTDLFLLGMVLYVVAIGMYQLFIGADIDVPDWMRVSDLDDLKAHLVSVIIVLLAVSFLAGAVVWEGDTSIAYFGAAISAVIISLGVYNMMPHEKDDSDH